MSLRLRLTLIVACCFLLGLMAVAIRSMFIARDEVRTEIIFSALLNTHLVELLNRDKSLGQDEFMAALRDELLGLEGSGRFRYILQADSDANSVNSEIQSYQYNVPKWFYGLLGIVDSTLVQSFTLANGKTVTIYSYPFGKIEEVWDESFYILSTRLGTLLFICSVLYLLIGRWLSPVSQITSVLDEVVRGDYSRRIPKIYISELNEVAEKTNFLATVLGASKVDNERLTRQALSVQEQERRYLAQELHDSLGQSVSAIKAMAVSIALRTQDTAPQVAASARSIEHISDGAYESVRDLMSWLRPAVLDELGLELALQQMIDDWNMHHEEIFCRLRIESNLSNFSGQQQIQVYRIVQEALTNVAKHSGADQVSVMLTGQEIITLMVIDNGRGFLRERSNMGIGLSSIRDRANVLNGNFTVSSKVGKGTSLQIEFPRQQGYRKHYES